jgi:hypothetical protein
MDALRLKLLVLLLVLVVLAWGTVRRNQEQVVEPVRMQNFAPEPSHKGELRKPRQWKV